MMNYRFTIEECLKIRKEYEKGSTALCLAKKYKAGNSTILDSIRRVGGRARTNSESGRIYHRSPIRERRLFVWYGLKAENVDYLYASQKGRCLWCFARLPKNPLKCFIDHIGGMKSLNKSPRIRRNSVRGLCCPHNICNMLAGRIEKDGYRKKDWGLLSAVSANINEILKTNKGGIRFPPVKRVIWTTA